MATPIDFEGANRWFGAPVGLEHEVQGMPVMKLGRQHVSAWQLSEAELKEVNESGVIYQMIMGDHLQPSFVGSESTTLEVIEFMEGNDIE